MSWFKEINSYTRGQKRALIAIWFITMTILAYDLFYNNFFLVNIIKIPQIDTLNIKTENPPSRKDDSHAIELKPFDPNNDSYDTLLAKGVPKRVAISITKLKEQGKIFKSEADLKKLYGMDDSLLTLLVPYCQFPEKTMDGKSSTKPVKIQISETFDPNITPYEKMIAIGVPENIAKTIGKYVAKGGRFKTPEDLMKLYNIDSAAFAQMKPKIVITQIEKEEIHLIQVELNTASFDELKKVSGIDKESIGKILYYRKRLGGYYSFRQLTEIDNLPDTTIEKLKGVCWIDTLQINRIAINRAEFSQLIRHPYLTKTEVETILRYRNFAKTIKSFDELKKNKVIGQTTAQKLKPYVSFD
ncbi:MAG TPA: helix-hairpin-helix domain-containing protein [Salinivirgaceae bacterium]|nr:helix-hairpin-helix domain-containing protein [Salinivirgaceae bacterium]